jgi:hypothetical protein
MHTSSPRVLQAVIATVALLVLLGLPARAEAAPGDYAVSIAGTTSAPGWSVQTNGGAFRTGDGYVDTAVGDFAADSYKRWRLSVPDTSVRIMGGRLRGWVASPNDAVIMQVRQGSIGNAVRNVLSTKAGSNFDATLFAYHDWVEFGLYSDSAIHTGDWGANRVALHALDLTLHDSVAPSLTMTAAPDPERWLGAGCATIGWSAADFGSGIGTNQLLNVTTGAVIGTWGQSASPGLQPGASSTSYAPCIQGSGQAHGVNDISVTTWDWSGRATSRTARLRFDLRGPTLANLTPAASTLSNPHPSWTLTVADPDSGVATIAASIDGAAVAATRTAGSIDIVTSTRLDVGDHTLVVTADDAVGNRTRFERSFTVVDTSPPLLTVRAPGTSGGATPELLVDAVDAGSAVDGRTWHVAVNGVAMTAVGTNALLHMPLGTLARGTHTIDLSVSDVHGNVARKTLSYSVTGSGAAGSGEARALSVGAPGGTGISYSMSIGPSVTFGQRIRIEASAVDHGRPLAGHRLAIARGPAVLDRQLADASGSVEFDVIVTAPGSLSISVAGNALPAVRIPLNVAPKLALRASRRSVERGRPVRIAGTIAPWRRMRGTVRLEARIDNSWYPLRRSIRVDRRGRFSTTVQSAVRGTIAVRVVRAPRRGWTQARSNIVVLKVR